MQKFTTHKGITAPLLRNNVDTDAIIPSVEMKRVSKHGLSDGLFAAWRYSDRIKRVPNPEFILNQPEFQGTSILLSGRNFGCGSSREHAVWALDEYGIRAIVAPSFGAIFSTNCIANGVLPARLPEDQVQLLANWVAADPQRNQPTIDLQKRSITASGGQVYSFEILDADADMLLQGLDPIAMTLQLEEAIQSFEQNDRLARPWVELAKSDGVAKPV
jgi:3-isopropylmalate/(R)-2-methylmalate dehydratase small subunit